jgi:hypothetical protein
MIVERGVVVRALPFQVSFALLDRWAATDRS